MESLNGLTYYTSNSIQINLCCFSTYFERQAMIFYIIRILAPTVPIKFTVMEVTRFPYHTKRKRTHKKKIKKIPCWVSMSNKTMARMLNIGQVVDAQFSYKISQLM